MPCKHEVISVWISACLWKRWLQQCGSLSLRRWSKRIPWACVIVTIVEFWASGSVRDPLSENKVESCWERPVISISVVLHMEAHTDVQTKVHWLIYLYYRTHDGAYYYCEMKITHWVCHLERYSVWSVFLCGMLSTINIHIERLSLVLIYLYLSLVWFPE